ncbi:hypothetical protein [Bifidobacterium callitrichos]|uniref:Uncharacterized protein n=1 Tax=Bifidobacterium callitrichos DSM 23973 TaxID=1437609 RepID=A0A087A906_9BIFI|nr:hypothetical protein [Bifidobacterium callitrichos]KFI55256.1 hypothetical protein BCAL_1272 [Bifidobacterium callitrichos DSM 23973]
MSRVVKCSRCRRRFRENAADAAQWNVVFKAGRVTGYLCPDCQSDEERLEAQVNEATLDYAHGAILPDGRAWVPFKGEATA